MGNEIYDYLTKQLFIDKNVVTFRSLSRQFKIHINAAKNELANFHANPDPSSGSVHATYLLTGELAPARIANGDSMDVDADVNSQTDEDGEHVQEVRVTLVGEQNLESVKSTYGRILSQHVYCLSPSPVIDAGLVCTPSEKVHEVDMKHKQDQAALLGRVIGPHVQKGKPVKFTAVPVKEPLSRRATEPAVSKAKDTLKKEDKEGEPQKKLKPSGTLDWGKAKPKAKAEEKDKPKDEKPKEKLKVKEDKPREDPKPKVKTSPPTKPVKPAASKSALPTRSETKLEPKRGVKRKSALNMDSSEEEEAPSSSHPSSRASSVVHSSPAPSPPPASIPVQEKKAAKLTRMVVLSDNEDDIPHKPATKGAGRGRGRMVAVEADMDVDALPSKKEMSLQAMMDIDDNQVIRASSRRKAASPPPPSSVETSPHPSPEPDEPDESTRGPDGDVDMADDYETSLNVKPQRRKRALKKAVPLGRNGLPKRRVVKSKMSTDERNFLITVDESEYESVDENDPDAQPAPPPAKGKKAKGKKAASSEDEKPPTRGKNAPEDTESDEEKSAKKSEKKLKEEKGEKKEPRKVIRPGRPVKRSSGSKAGQGSLKSFFPQK